MGIIAAIKDRIEKNKARKLMGKQEINDADKNLEVVLQTLPMDYSLNPDDLVEITEPSVLARIDGVVFKAGMAGAKLAKSVATPTEKLYKVVIKSGGNLANSHQLVGAKRAMSVAKNGIAPQASLVETNVSQINKAVNISANVYSIAAIIVGQHYMKQINAKMSAISDEIKCIANTLDIQYKSEVCSLFESVENILKFQYDTAKNEETRIRDLNNIQELRKDCQKLLNQAEFEIESLLIGDNSNYDKYSESVKRVEKWRQYQAILMQILYQIDDLDFVLSMGKRSKEYCFGSFPAHTKKLEDSRSAIIAWHEKQCEKLKIDVEQERRKSIGLLAKVFEKPIGAINEKWVYKSIDKETADLIKRQITESDKYSYNTDNPFEKDVEIVVCGDKKYYVA